MPRKLSHYRVKRTPPAWGGDPWGVYQPSVDEWIVTAGTRAGAVRAKRDLETGALWRSPAGTRYNPATVTIHVGREARLRAKLHTLLRGRGFTDAVERKLREYGARIGATEAELTTAVATFALHRPALVRHVRRGAPGPRRARRKVTRVLGHVIQHLGRGRGYEVRPYGVVLRSLDAAKRWVRAHVGATVRRKPRPNPGRPPKRWFRRMVAEVKRKGSAADPAAVVGHIWHHLLTRAQRHAIVAAEEG